MVPNLAPSHYPGLPLPAAHLLETTLSPMYSPSSPDLSSSLYKSLFPFSLWVPKSQKGSPLIEAVVLGKCFSVNGNVTPSPICEADKRRLSLLGFSLPPPHWASGDLYSGVPQSTANHQDERPSPFVCVIHLFFIFLL